MEKQEQVSYLANIYHLLLADGGVERIEEKAFEEISRDIGGGYFERKNAVELARNEPYQHQWVGRWSDRIRCLEDMLFAAFCNGVVDRIESKLIKDCAKSLGITQGQFDVIKQEAQRRFAQYKARTT